MTTPSVILDYTFPSGATYTGTFHENLRHGKGYWSHPKGELYEGEYQLNKKHGLGVYRFKSTGKMYIGEWKNDKIEGEGIYYFNAQHTSLYFGGYLADKKHGKGIYLYENGVFTAQEWNNGSLICEIALPVDQLLEYATRKRALIDRVRRNVAPRMLGEVPPESEVRAFQFASGATYTGQYYGSKKHGVGQWVHPKGDQYDGQFEFNMHHGWGIYTIGWSGKKFVGEWKAGKMNGVGVYFFNPEEAEYFVGTYRNDVKHGKGMYHFKVNQQNKIQWWEEGTLVREENPSDEEVKAYEKLIQDVIDVVKQYAPEYQQKIFKDKIEGENRNSSGRETGEEDEDEDEAEDEDGGNDDDEEEESQGSVEEE